MVNTNKIISYLTQKHLCVDEAPSNPPEQMHNGLTIETTRAGLARKGIEQANSMREDIKDACLELHRQALELDSLMSSSENFMLGQSATSFYLPLKG